MSSSPSVESAPWRLRPHTLQAAKNRPPRRAAPPTPTQTPMTAFLVPDAIPEFFLEVDSLAREADWEAESEPVEVEDPEVFDAPDDVVVTSVVFVCTDSVLDGAELGVV